MESRRRARLTPLSGELRATEDWVHVEPVEAKPKKRHRHRKRKPLPTTTVGMLVYGVRRLVFYTGVICGAIVLAAYLISLGGRSFIHVLTLAFYLAGAFFGAIAFLGGTAGFDRWNWNRSERERAFNQSFVFIFFAALMFGIGVALEAFG
jgi:hypothetical protein